MKRPLLAVLLLTLAPAIPPRAQDDLGVPSKDGLVVCVSAPACDAGASVLARGGNAVDAAVATAFALAVTHPSAGNIGGGGFMIVRTPSGRLTAFDYREKAPLKSTRTMYLDKDGNIDRKLTATGYLAPGVPGAVRGLEAAHEKFGKLPWKDVVMPGVTLAEQGFALSPALARSLNGELKQMAPVPRLRRGLRQAWRRRVGRRRSARADRSRTHAASHCDRRSRRVLQRLDCRSNRRRHGRTTAASSPRPTLPPTKPRSEIPVRGRYREFEIVVDVAAEQRRHRVDRDAQHPGAAEPESQRAADRPGAPRPDRSDAPRLPRSRPVSRRSGFRRHPGLEVDVQAARTRRRVHVQA